MSRRTNPRICLVLFSLAHTACKHKHKKNKRVRCASFSLLRNLITRLHLKFLPKLRKNYKKYCISWTTGSHCTLMADSIRIAQPIRLQYFQYTSRILLKLDRNMESMFFLFLSENTAAKTGKQLVNFDYQIVNSLCSRHE